MDIRVEQGCPQCGAAIVLEENQRLLACTFCGVTSYVQTPGLARYHLPCSSKQSLEAPLYAPYLRFKGSIFVVTDQGIRHRVVDTTQNASTLAGLPPSLGVRPQAMHLQRVMPETPGRYLLRSVKVAAILEKAAQVSTMTGRLGHTVFHRAYIGESLSCIYLPLTLQDQEIVDGVTNTLLLTTQGLPPRSLTVRPFHPAWETRFLATLCPHCGADLQGEGGARILRCLNCHTLWEVASTGLVPVDWQMLPPPHKVPLYLPFWQITARIEALQIESFADFVERSNQPFLPRAEWRSLPFALWIPAITLRPKIFLQAGRQVTLGQWRLRSQQGRLLPEFLPATLASTEARQAAKVILAAATATPRRIFPLLPKVALSDLQQQLVYLPLQDRGHDWVQPDTGVVISKHVLRLGHSLAL